MATEALRRSAAVARVSDYLQIAYERVKSDG